MFSHNRRDGYRPDSLTSCLLALVINFAGAGVALADQRAQGVTATNGAIAGTAELPTPRNDLASGSIKPIEGPLKVGTKAIVPFVFVEGETIPYGYSIDLWQAIADKMDVETEFVTYDTISAMLNGVRQGDVDVAIAGISITDEREASGLDFSYPMYQAGLQLITVDRSTLPFLRFLNYIANWSTVATLVRVFIGCLIVGSLIWLMERRHNPAFQHGPVAGVGQGIWFALATLGTFGYGDVTPMKPLGRGVAVVWMGASFFILADFIASMTAAYQAHTPVYDLTQVYNRPVGTINGSTAADFLRSRPVQLVELDSYEAIFAKLAAGDLYAAVIDYPTAKYEMARQPKLIMAGQRLNREDYGIAVQEGNIALLEEINRDILALQKEGFFETLETKWFSGKTVTQGKPSESWLSLSLERINQDVLPSER